MLINMHGSTANLRFFFAYAKPRFSLDMAHFIYSSKIIQTFQTERLVDKQCRPTSDSTWRSSLTSVYTSCHSVCTFLLFFFYSKTSLKCVLLLLFHNRGNPQLSFNSCVNFSISLSFSFIVFLRLSISLRFFTSLAFRFSIT